jgi:hypothetical protein
MASSPRREARLTVIRANLAEVERLLALARQEPMKEQVRRANRDLDEAAEWLNKQDVDHRPSILKIADLALGLAAWRLTMVNRALDKYGPDATLFV